MGGFGGRAEVVDAGGPDVGEDFAGGRVEGLQLRPARGGDEGAAVRRAGDGPAGGDPESRQDGVGARLCFVLGLP